MNIVKFIFIISLSVLLVGCTSKYVEPPISSTNSKLIISHEKHDVESFFELKIGAYLDGQFIGFDMYQLNPPPLTVEVRPGKHKLKVEIESLYSGRIKRNVTKEYIIDFKEKESYKITAKINTIKLKNRLEDVFAEYEIQGNLINISDKLLIEDSFLRSPSSLSNKDIQKIVIEALVPQILN